LARLELAERRREIDATGTGSSGAPSRFRLLAVGAGAPSNYKVTDSQANATAIDRRFAVLA
jgi:hypothetical protein